MPRRWCWVALLLLVSCSSTGEPRLRVRGARRGAPRASAGDISCAGIRCAHIHRLMRPAQTPPLDRPRALGAGFAAILAPADRVIGVVLGGQARAYPLNLLSYHRVINDELAGQRISVAFSPLTESTLCAVGSRPLRASGLIYENDELLTDAQGTELWSVMLGRNVRGKRAGVGLEQLPCGVMTWSAWSRLQAKTTVAWPPRAPLGFDYRQDPWRWYREDERHLVGPLHVVDLRLPRKQTVVGMAYGDQAWAWPLEKRVARVINATLSGEEILVVLDGPSEFGGAYLRRLDSRVLTFRGAPLSLVDEQTGSRWSALGEGLSGPLKGKRLRPAPSKTALFLGWAAFHPGTAIDELNILASRRKDRE